MKYYILIPVRPGRIMNYGGVPLALIDEAMLRDALLLIDKQIEIDQLKLEGDALRAQLEKLKSQ